MPDEAPRCCKDMTGALTRGEVMTALTRFAKNTNAMDYAIGPPFKYCPWCGEKIQKPQKGHDPDEGFIDDHSDPIG